MATQIHNLNSMLTVSVVIPSYNAVNTIARALKSVQHQSFPPLEIIVVDDASTDDTTKVIEQIRNQLMPIETHVVCSQSNQGAACARNTGWNLAKGDLVAFLDADDSWHPRKLELQATWLAANPLVQACGHAYEIQDANMTIAWDTVDQIKFGNIKHYTFNDFLMKNRLSTPTVMLRRNLKERFPINKRFCEDYDLWLQISHNFGLCAWSNSQLTRLHKQAWGVSGLSADLWSMYRAEMQCYKDCLSKGWISRRKQLSLAFLSSLKHCRRVIKKSLGFSG